MEEKTHQRTLHSVRTIPLLYTCARDGLDTVQLALAVFFLSSTSENTPLALMVVIAHCNLYWWCYLLGTYCNLPCVEVLLVVVFMLLLCLYVVVVVYMQW